MITSICPRLSSRLLSRSVNFQVMGHRQNHVKTAFNLTGIYPTVVTPFDSSSEQVDFEKFKNTLRHLDRYPVAGFALLGVAGEFASISNERKVEIVKTARNFLGQDRIIMAGASGQSTNRTLKLIISMAEAGADACFVTNPSFFKMQLDTEAYVEHYTKLAEQSPIPIALYNIPSYNVEENIPIEVIAELAKNPKIVGLLDTHADIARLAQICMLTSKFQCKRTNPFNIIAGNASFLWPALSVGCTGAVCSMANVLPFELCHMMDLHEGRKIKEAQHLQWRIMEPNHAITIKYGVAGLKSVLKAHYGLDTGSVRSPLRDLTEEEEQDVLNIFKKSGFLN